MERLGGFLQQLVIGLGGTWGGVGLLVVAFFDSSFLSLPEVNDLLVFYFCTQFKSYAYYFALMAVIGSTVGCTVLFGLGRWKGYRYLERRYSSTKLQRAFRTYQRYGVLALIGPALLPPPFPFKIFVLSAGIFGLSFPRFLLATLMGRGFRYFFEAAMAVRYGDRALAYVERNYPQVAVTLVVILALGMAVYVLAKHLRQRQASTAADRTVAVPKAD